MHSWVSVYCPGFGWVDLNPTNDLLPSDTHILPAWGRDYDDVIPINGAILGGGQHAVHVAVDLTRPPPRHGPVPSGNPGMRLTRPAGGGMLGAIAAGPARGRVPGRVPSTG
jgi:hypothetical protein